MKGDSRGRDALKQLELAMRAEDAVHALRTLAFEPYPDRPKIEPEEGEAPELYEERRKMAELEWRGRLNYQQDILGRFVRLLASQVETLNRWIEELPADDPHLEVIREFARGWNDWPFSMRPTSKTPSFINELAEKIELGSEPIHKLPKHSEALAHRWLAYAIGKFNLAREYREHAKSEDALDGSLRAISPDEATATILIKASELATLSSDSHAEWLRLLIEFTQVSNDRHAVALVKNAERTKKAQKGNFNDGLSSSLGGRLQKWW